jgi:hypothetical protein
MLETLTSPNYPKAAIGLEKDTVTALALGRRGRGRYGIRQAATVSLPERLLSPSFTDTNISNANELLVFLNEAVNNAGLRRQKRWSVSLPSSAARTAILSLETEPASKDELQQILDWKAENIFGVPATELRISQQRMSPDAAGKARYFSTAVKLTVLDEYETLFESLGWKVGLILPRAISEARWLVNRDSRRDSLLISSHHDGFTALLLRGDEPKVVRTVTCTDQERDDEIFRLLMFYQDRFATENPEGLLQRLLVVGRDFDLKRIAEISQEALGVALDALRPDEVGLEIPISSLQFDDVAAPAGIASMAWA